MKHKNIVGPTKRKKVRIVDFGDTLTEILKAARKVQLKNRMQYGELYHRKGTMQATRNPQFELSGIIL